MQLNIFFLHFNLESTIEHFGGHMLWQKKYWIWNMDHCVPVPGLSLASSFHELILLDLFSPYKMWVSTNLILRHFPRVN